MFFELLQISVGKREALSRVPSAEEWNNLYVLSKEHALRGVIYTAVEKLPQEQRPDMDLMLKWYGVAKKESDRCRRAYRNCVAMSRDLTRNGKRHAILKGQGMALLYQQPFARACGDIDVWLEGSRMDIVDFMSRRTEVKKITYHHCEAHLASDDEVEIHFVPSWMYSYRLNRRLQHYFAQVQKEDFACKVSSPEGSGDFYVATMNFNRVFILVHIYRHFIQEGVGFRQLMDYYYVLRQGCSAAEREETMATLRALKMSHFAAGMMYVLQEVFCLEDEFLLTTPEPTLGKFLLSEITRSGNFGRADERMQQKGKVSHWSLFVKQAQRDVRFLRYFPEEILMMPFFKIWHYGWRKYHGWM